MSSFYLENFNDINKFTNTTWESGRKNPSKVIVTYKKRDVLDTILKGNIKILVQNNMYPYFKYIFGLKITFLSRKKKMNAK